jgi:hypothetical protein
MISKGSIVLLDQATHGVVWVISPNLRVFIWKFTSAICTLEADLKLVE